MNHPRKCIRINLSIMIYFLIIFWIPFIICKPHQITNESNQTSQGNPDGNVRLANVTKFGNIYVNFRNSSRELFQNDNGRRIITENEQSRYTNADCPQLTARAFNGRPESVLLLEPLNLSSPTAPAAVPSAVLFHCRFPGFRPKFKSNRLQCGADGRWHLVNENGAVQLKIDIQDVLDLCESENKQFPVDSCRRLPGRSGLIIRYKSTRSHFDAISIGDEVIVTCSQPNHVFQSRQRASQAIYRCLDTGLWSNRDEIPFLTCVSVGCPHPISDQNLRPVFEEQSENIEYQGALSLSSTGSFSTVPHGTRIFYTCTDPDRYYLIGDREYVCNSNGTWTPKFWPVCDRKRKCPSPNFPSGGYYANPSEENFEPGHLLNFGCIEGYRLEGRASLRCLDSGEWNYRPPTCVRDELSTKRFIAVSCVVGILGILLLILFGFFLKRQLLLRKALNAATRRHRHGDSRLRLPSINVGVSGALRQHHPSHLIRNATRARPASDSDRLALIAFADGDQVPLPSYEEAVNEGNSDRAGQSLPTINEYCSRAIRRLPNLPWSRESGIGNGVVTQQLVQCNSNNGNDGQFTSNETIPVSDVMLETVSNGDRNQSVADGVCTGSVSSSPVSVHSSSAAVDQSDNAGLPLLELQEEDLIEETRLNDGTQQQEGVFGSNEDICSRKSSDA